MPGKSLSREKLLDLLYRASWDTKTYIPPDDDLLDYAEELGVRSRGEARDLLAAYMVSRGLIDGKGAAAVVAVSRSRMRRYLEKIREIDAAKNASPQAQP